MKIVLTVLLCIIPFYISGSEVTKKPEFSKPMRLFVEIDGKLYEALIDKKGNPRPKDLADTLIHTRFKSEAKFFGVAYLQDRILLEKKDSLKAGP